MEAQEMSAEEKKVVEAEKVVEAAPVQEEVTMAVVERDPNAPVVTMKKLLEAGVHFGHQTRKWNPKMGKYIYTARNGVYIVDLQKTAQLCQVAYLALKDIVDKGGKVLFVGTKKQTQEIVSEEALRSGSFFVSNRWLGGTLTNFKTIQSRIRYLKELERREAEGGFDILPKKEAALLRKEMEKLSKNLDGIKEMRRTPNAIFVVDPKTEHIAVQEAHILHIPVFGIVDTNSDPDEVDYVIPGNDDAIRSVKLITALMADAIVESKGGIPVIAYTKDEGEEVTMKDAIRQADKANAEKLAAIRAARKEKQENYERIQALKAQARSERSRTQQPAKEEAPKAETKAEEAPKAEVKE